MIIYVINLKESITRREDIKNKLSGISFEFFHAEALSDKPNHEIYKLYDSRKTLKYKGYNLTTPELGCWASHFSLWKKCVKDNSPILILEDNIEIFGNLSKQIENIEKLVNKYGLIKLGNIFERNFVDIDRIDDQYRLISNLRGACGTSAYAISPQAANNYLNKINNFFEPIDDFMDNEWRTGQTVYSYYPQLVSRSQTVSTIGQRKVKGNLSLVNKLQIEGYRLFKKWKQKQYNKKNKL
ncbi:TPA: glycosyl transferase [Vibrio vulnificus]|nr:glycosyl transferase [Vibrio vulnificus]